ncbi:unnamed protein product [Mesocestoides corti]|uniref:Ovule protein n=1 Tax=Mesocestoides corti TaxID=53468 RepID=A0A0R3U170_MESCO|nr:unnamed protein product [Mesocestoides corti]
MQDCLFSQIKRPGKERLHNLCQLPGQHLGPIRHWERPSYLAIYIQSPIILISCEVKIAVKLIPSPSALPIPLHLQVPKGVAHGQFKRHL